MPEWFQDAKIGGIHNSNFYDISGGFQQNVYLVINDVAHISARQIPPIRNNHQAQSTLGISKSPHGTNSTSESSVTLADIRPRQFDAVEDALQAIELFVKPYSDTVFKNLHLEIRQLQKLVALSYIGYRACSNTNIGTLVKNQFNLEMKRCEATLSNVLHLLRGLACDHLLVCHVASRWMPRQVADIVSQYWESVEITSIRLEISQEREAFGPLCAPPPLLTNGRVSGWVGGKQRLSRPWPTVATGQAADSLPLAINGHFLDRNGMFYLLPAVGFQWPVRCVPMASEYANPLKVGGANS